MVGYAYQGKEEGIVKANGTRRPISTKYSVEICKAIKGKRLEYAKQMLQDAADLKKPIKITRFTDGAGHKPGVGPGKYPVKACKEILKVLKSAEANAQNKGLGADLKVLHAAAHQAARSFKYGRMSRRQEKSTHVEIVLKETTEPKKAKQKTTKKEPAKEKTETVQPKAAVEEKLDSKKEVKQAEPVKKETKESKEEIKEKKPAEAGKKVDKK